MGRREVLGSIFAGYVLLASHNPLQSILWPIINPFLTANLPKFSYPQNPHNKPHCINSIENVTSLQLIQL